MGEWRFMEDMEYSIHHNCFSSDVPRPFKIALLPAWITQWQKLYKILFTTIFVCNNTSMFLNMGYVLIYIAWPVSHHILFLFLHARKGVSKNRRPQTNFKLRVKKAVHEVSNWDWEGIQISRYPHSTILPIMFCKEI